MADASTGVSSGSWPNCVALILSGVSVYLCRVSGLVCSGKEDLAYVTP